MHASHNSRLLIRFRVALWAIFVCGVGMQAAAQNNAATSLSFSGEKIEDVMSLLADATGLNIILSDGAAGKQISAFIPEMEPVRALQEIVKVNGLHLVRNEDVVWILSDDEFFDDFDIGRERRLVRFKHARVERLLPVANDLLSAHGRIQSFPDLNILVIGDIPERLAEIVPMIEQLDEATETRVYLLQHAAALDMMQLLTPHVSGAANLYADFRTNQLSVTGTVEQLDRISELLQKFDRPDLVLTKSITLRYANADQVAEILREVLTGRRSTAQGASGGFGEPGQGAQEPVPTALPSATMSEMPTTRGATSLEARRTLGSPVREGQVSLRNLDVAQAGSSPAAPTAPLTPNTASGAAPEGEAAALGPLANITADTRTNTVIITHTEDVVKRLESIVASIDVPDRFEQYQFQNVNPADIDIESKLAALLPQENTFLAVDPLSRTVTFRASPDHAQEIRGLLELWDSFIRQVRIDGEILRVNVSVVKDLGISWEALLDNSGSFADVFFPPSIAATSPQGTLGLGSLDNSDFEATITALATDNDTKSLASPRIVVRDGGEALFSTARDEPFTVVTVDGNTQTTLQDVRFLNVGVNLSVAPVINREDLITLDVSLEISELIEIRNDIPVVDRSTAQSSVSVRDGNTLILGGLRQTQSSEVVNGVPVLRNIPLLGNLFRNKSTDDREFEILLVLRPSILDVPDDIVPSLDELYETVSSPLREDARDWELLKIDPIRD